MEIHKNGLMIHDAGQNAITMRGEISNIADIGWSLNLEMDPKGTEGLAVKCPALKRRVKVDAFSEH